MSLSPCFKWILCSLLWLPITGVADTFTLYTYHQKPPYYFKKKEESSVLGVYQALVDYLNRAQSDIFVKLEFRPRIRLENELNSGQLKGAIVGVNPLWFKDKSKTRYFWTEAFMNDQDVIVVRNGQEFPFAHPRDLEGRTMALPRGLYFWGVTERIKEKKIKVFETDSDIQNLSMVAYNRADATILSILTANYLFEKEFKDTWFSILETPHDKFERSILFPRYYKYEYRKLNNLLKKVMSDNEWQSVLKHWRKE